MYDLDFCGSNITILVTIAAVIIASTLEDKQKKALGETFSLIGQTLLTIEANCKKTEQSQKMYGKQ